MTQVLPGFFSTPRISRLLPVSLHYPPLPRVIIPVEADVPVEADPEPESRPRPKSIIPFEAGQTKAAIFGDLHVILCAGMNADGPTKLAVEAFHCKGGEGARRVIADISFDPPAVLIEGGEDLFRPLIWTPEGLQEKVRSMSRWVPLDLREGSSYSYYRAATCLDATRPHLITIRTQGGEEESFELQAAPEKPYL